MAFDYDYRRETLSSFEPTYVEAQLAQCVQFLEHVRPLIASVPV